MQDYGKRKTVFQDYDVENNENIFEKMSQGNMKKVTSFLIYFLTFQYKHRKLLHLRFQYFCTVDIVKLS